MPEGNKPNCYVASPDGFAESTKYWYDNVLLPMLDNYVTVIDPWRIDVSQILEAEGVKKRELWTDLGDKCYDDVDRSKLVIALLDQEPPDNGTVSEVVWAAAHNIPVIGYRNDARTSGEKGMPYNLMIAAAIRRSGGVALASMLELEQQLQNPGTIALRQALQS
jgi:nucleoside 2-deoxyribosyltransferase